MVLWNPSAISTAEVRVVHATDGNKFGVDMGNKDNSYLHYPRFRRSAFTGDQDVEHLGLPDKVNIASVILKKNEYLFVPNTMLASVSHHRSSLGDEALLLKSCMVDASNLNAFREAIVTPAHLYAYESALSKEVDRADFNVTMNVFPEDQSLADLKTAVEAYHSRPTPSARTSPSPAAADEAPEGRSSHGDADAKGRKRERRGGDGRRTKTRPQRRGTNLKGWADANRWASLVQGLTIPPAPVAVAKGIWLPQSHARVACHLRAQGRRHDLLQVCLDGVSRCRDTSGRCAYGPRRVRRGGR